jgi:arylsulfatase A-like enzyme
MTRRPHLSALLFAVALAASCGGDPAPRSSSAGTVRRVELRTFGDAPPTGLVTTFKAAVRAELPEGWHVDARESGILELPGRDQGEQGTHQLRIFGRNGGPAAVFIPGSFDTRTFNQAALTVTHRSKVDLQVGFSGRNRQKLLYRSKTLRVPGTGHPATFVIDLSDLKDADEPYQHLAVLFPMDDNAAGLVSVALLARPLRSYLPACGEPPTHVALGTESRPAVGLADDLPLVSERFVPAPGEYLEFSYGRPPAMARAAATLTAEVVPDTGAPVRKTFALGAGIDYWEEARVDLAAFAGREVDVRFALADERGGEVAAALVRPVLVSPGSRSPTVVLITSDTHRADHWAARRGSVDVKTPFMDELARRGVMFEDAFAPTNITNPSHISIMTALSPRDTGVIDNITAVSAQADTVAERFRDAGYATLAATSASHIRSHQSGLGQGFDRLYVPAEKKCDSLETIGRLEYWLPHFDDRPLFVWLHVFDAHGPYDPPEDYTLLYYERNKDPRSKDLPELTDDQKVRWDEEVRDLDYVRASYKGEVTYLNDRIGELFAKWTRLDDGLVVFTSDHGESLGGHGIYFQHKDLYPDLLHVPLVIAGPGVPSGQVVSQRVSLLDLGATLLSAAGVPRDGFPGEDLLAGVARDKPRYTLSSHGISASLNLDDWYLILHLRSHQRWGSSTPYEQHQLELFDLGADPDCLTDLVDAPDQRERVVGLRELLVRWLQDAEAGGLSVVSAGADTDALAELAALGYLTDVAPAADVWWSEEDAECACSWCARFGGAR